MTFHHQGVPRTPPLDTCQPAHSLQNLSRTSLCSATSSTFCRKILHPRHVRSVPGWTVITALLPPLLIVGGSAIAATLQPLPFNQVHYSISQLAAHGATDRWIMNLFILGASLCTVLSAVGLRTVRMAGRLTLAVSGLAAIGVVAFPDQWIGGHPAPVDATDHHTVSAWVVFLAAALWPTLAANHTGPLRLRWGLGLSAIQLAPAGWKITQDVNHGDYLGLSERVLLGLEGLVLLAVVLMARRQVAHR